MRRGGKLRYLAEVGNTAIASKTRRQSTIDLGGRIANRGIGRPEHFDGSKPAHDDHRGMTYQGGKSDEGCTTGQIV